jgi:type II secretory pathway pseudopilin PulG
MSLFQGLYFTKKSLQSFNEEEGTTLVEELVTVAIIGIGIVILVAMIYTGVKGVRLVDDKMLAESLARSQLEIIKDAAYQDDPVSVPYPAVAPIPNYSVAVGIEYWNASSSIFVSAVRNDGLQKITVTVSSAGTPLVQNAEYKVDR